MSATGREVEGERRKESESESKKPKTHDRRSNEPPRVADRVEEGEGFLHSILGESKRRKEEQRETGQRRDEDVMRRDDGGRGRRTTDSSSYNRMSYSEIATRKTMAVTFSKQWILGAKQDERKSQQELDENRRKTKACSKLTTSSSQTSVLRHRTACRPTLRS